MAERDHKSRDPRRGLPLWLLGGGGIIGLLLLLRGDLLIGGLLLLFAAVRIAYVARRRSQWAASSDGADRSAQQLLRSLAPRAFAAAARQLGMAPEELQGDFRSGRSIAELARERQADGELVRQAMEQAMAKGLDELRDAGELDPALSERASSRLPRWTARVLELHRSELSG